MFEAKNLSMGQVNALVKNIGGEEAVRAILDGTLTVQIKGDPHKPLVAFYKTIIDGDGAPFHVFDVFCGPNERICVSRNFREDFFGRVEDPGLPMRIVAYRVTNIIHTNTIMEELGDEAETNLRCLYTFLNRQRHGEVGCLSVNRNCANVFRVRNAKGEFRMVQAVWNDRSPRGYWDIFSVSDRRTIEARWPLLTRVFAQAPRTY